jgi:hypothetical protein
MPGSYGGRAVQEIKYHLANYGNIKGKTGLVIGSQTPWLEGILLAMGATKVILRRSFFAINFYTKNYVFFLI